MNKDKSIPCNINYFDKIQAKSIDWLWYPYIPFGKITIVQGDLGEGKTTFVLNIAALISKGLPMPKSNVQRTVARVIYQSTEDGLADTVKPRLISACTNCANIAYIDDTTQSLTLNDPRIEEINQAT